MLPRVAGLAAVALSVVAGLHLQDQGQGPQLAQAGGELTDADEAQAAWPWSRRKQAAVAQPAGRVAVLVSGSLEKLLLSPLLANVVRVNAQRGLKVDVFFRLKVPATFGKKWFQRGHTEATDPKIASLLLQTLDEEAFNGTVMDSICQLAEAHLASSCRWDIEGDDPLSMPPDATHRQIMTQSSPLETTEGRAVVARWRSLSRLYTAARARAKILQEEYAAFLATNEDDYWLAPRLINIQAFQMDPLQVSVVPCMDATGVNDKSVIMGRDAADVMLRMYSAWQKGDMRLEGTRTAEEAWFRIASQSGVNLKPEPMYAASASYTHSGLPCFHESTFNLRKDEDYEQCFAEDAEDAPVTGFFMNFSCETMRPVFYELLWPQQVQRLHQALADLAKFGERTQLVVTVVGPGEVEMAVNMLTSREATGDDSSSLVIGTGVGICKSLSDTLGVSGDKCIAMQPAHDVRSSVFKHAILTTIAAAGLSDSIVYATPGVRFSAAPQAPQKHVVFAKKSCGDTTADETQIDGNVIQLTDAPEATEILLRAWELMVIDENLSHSAALHAAVKATSYAEVGLLSCDSHHCTNASSCADAAEADHILSWQTPPGVAANMSSQHKKVSSKSWAERKRSQASGKSHRKRAAKSDSQRRGEYRKDAKAWNEVWEKRINELREENGYNETEVREQRKVRRQWNKAHKAPQKKHVRYLPPDEAAKVKAKDEAWEAGQEKQKQDDLAHADGRKEAFQREVEKAQGAMAGAEDAQEGDDDSTDEETEAA